MKRNNKNYLCISVCTFAAFILWTAAVIFIDVQPIGPLQSCVGFASVNSYVHNLICVHMALYTITDWLSIIPAGFIAGFGTLGLVQLIKRKNILKVDYSILALGGFYIAIMAAYLMFEKFAVNYRPVLIDGVLEASYPSSTTLLVLCVMPTAAMQMKERLKNAVIKKYSVLAIYIFTAFMLMCRIVSGVHWITDIIGGVLLSAALVTMYCYINSLNKN